MEPKNCLIVEDETSIADSLQKGLNEQNFSATVAYDGITGWRLVQQHAFDIVLLDVNLPGINGIELCKKIRTLDKNIPVLMITAFGAIDDRLKGYEAGADDYIVKPFELKELVMKMKVMLRRTLTKSAEMNLLRVDELEMNLDSMEVKRGEKKISLTTKEFQLLQYLLENKNKVLSRSEIAMNVWEIDFDTNTNVIDVYINYLRNKIDKGFDRKLIQTQVGKGYILKENA